MFQVYWPYQWQRCKHLRVQDVLFEMLKFLKQNAEKENVSNITYINKAFETAVIGKDVEKHDIVVASRSMGWK